MSLYSHADFPPGERANPLGYRFYVNYGQGWEYELFEDTLADARTMAKSYRENAPQYPVRFERGRLHRKGDA